MFNNITKSFIIVLVSLIFSSAYAIDTTECFTPGIATDFEAYYGNTWDNTTKSPSGEFIIGGGFTETFSYLVTGGISHENPVGEDKIRTFGGIGLGLIWTVIEQENKFALDIMPAFTFEPNDAADNGKSVKPNFKGFSYGGVIEGNLMVISMFQPYLLAGFTNYHNTSEIADDVFEDDPYEIPLTLGAMVPVRDGVEILAQIDWTLNEDTKKWKETDRSAALGMNVILSGNLELILEYSRGLKVEDADGNEVSPRKWGIGIGAIYAL